jgi:hypothetical protein
MNAVKEDLMELTYKVRGDDGKEYGPASLLQISKWLREGRMDLQTEMTRSDISYWAPASNFSEVAATATSSVSPATPAAAVGHSVPRRSDPATEAQLKSGASWFYWVAGLSLINSIVALSGSEWGFVLGLGITQIFDAFGQSLPGAGKVVVLVLDVIAAGVLVLFGVFAHKRHTWAFVVGMILYALDGLIFLLVRDWLALGFHAFVLYCLFRGFKACRELNAA